MRLVILLGKGGVGKSTCACAMADQLAKKGECTLLASFDPAHNLGDIFGKKFTGKIKKFSANLDILEVDTKKSAEDYIAKTKDLIKQVYSYTSAYNIDGYFKLFRYLPGIQEYASLTALLQLLQTSGDKYENIVLDTPPTGLALRILALASISLKWLKQLKSLREKILDRRHTIASINDTDNELRCRQAMKDDRVLGKIQKMISDYRWLEDLLKSQKSSCGVVLNLDALSLKESLRIKAGLKEIGIPLRFLLINKVEAAKQEQILQIKKDLQDKQTVCIQVARNSDYKEFEADLSKIFKEKKRDEDGR